MVLRMVRLMSFTEKWRSVCSLYPSPYLKVRYRSCGKKNKWHRLALFTVTDLFVCFGDYVVGRGSPQQVIYDSAVRRNDTFMPISDDWQHGILRVDSCNDRTIYKLSGEPSCGTLMYLRGVALSVMFAQTVKTNMKSWQLKIGPPSGGRLSCASFQIQVPHHHRIRGNYRWGSTHDSQLLFDISFTWRRVLRPDLW